MKNVIFGGPSVYGLSLKGAAELNILPPAACGDLLKAVRAGAKTIGLVDGLFGAEPSVWHKEILVALSRGVRVFGASSMGALRAAECAPFGMIGIGKIFEAYRDGNRVADADVALLHCPAEMEFRPLTVALVNVDATLDALIERRLISTTGVSRLRRAARALHYSERTWRAVAARARMDRALLLLELHQVDQKRLDAAALICAMKKPPRISKNPGWALNQTLFLRALEERI